MLPEIISAGAASIALVVSVVALRSTKASQIHTARSVVVRSAFEAFNDLSNLRIHYWQTAHLLSLPENYELESSMVRQAADEYSGPERAQFFILERSVATRIFELFEQSVYELRLARESGDQGREQFQQEVYNHFTRRLLRNPRLAYLWKAKDSALSGYFEEYTIQAYNKDVHASEMDDMGPIAPARPAAAE